MHRLRASTDRITRETGMLAGRLAAFLDGVFPEAGRAVDGREFLESASQALKHEAAPRKQAGALAGDPLERLAKALALVRTEIDLCVLAGMAEEHEGFAAVFRSLHPRGDSRPSAGLAAQFLCDDAAQRSTLRELLEAGPAVSSGLLRVVGDGPFYERSLQLAEGLWPVLRGINVWPTGVPYAQWPPVTNGLQEWFSGAAAARAAAAIASDEPCTVMLTGDSEESAFHRALALVHHAGREPAGIILPAVVDRDLERLIGVHALTRGSVPVLRLAPPEGPRAAESPLFLEYPATVVLCGLSGAVPIRGRRPLLTVEAGRLTAPARQEMWRATLPSLESRAAYLAARYPIEPAAAADVAADLAMRRRFASAPITEDQVAECLRARAGLSLLGGVKLIRPAATWDDLVLPTDRLVQLREAVNRLLLQDRVLDDWGFLKGRPGARGVRMLFSGPPGTGKTLSAEVLAHSLAVDLLFVDISRVVSKWIGETEKNLAAVFETAERAQAVLFFDEADALFGKRTEVSDAHDRYANLETAYLLSRLERFEGLAILATNLRQNIDPAFIRRLEFAIDFDAPDREERLALWQVHVPRNAPLASDVDLRELAVLYPVVGAFIRNAATAAGFLAASNGAIISRGHFIHAIRREYEKAGRAFPGASAGVGNS
jgi:hypothetical protein